MLQEHADGCRAAWLGFGEFWGLDFSPSGAPRCVPAPHSSHVGVGEKGTGTRRGTVGTAERLGHSRRGHRVTLAPWPWPPRPSTAAAADVPRSEGDKKDAKRTKR